MSFLSRISWGLKFLLKIIFHNWIAKLLSFVVAVIFYLNLQASKLTVKTIEVPIEYPRLSASFIYGKNNPKTLKVKVEGFKDLVNYHSQFLKVTIDQNDLHVGENFIEVKKFWGTSPRIKVVPENETISVNVEHSFSKSVPVDVNFEGDLPPNLVKTSYSIKPKLITLSGTKEILDSVSKYSLGRVNLGSTKESTTQSLRPPEPPKGITIIGGIREYQLRINILRVSSGTGEQIFGGIPIRCEGKNDNLIAILSQDEVSIKFNSPVPFNNIEIFQGIKATVPCNYSYDPRTKKIIPNNLPVSGKVRVIKSNNLKSIEILSVIPEKVTIQYRVKQKDYDENRLQDDPAFDDIIWPDSPKEDPRYP